MTLSKVDRTDNVRFALRLTLENLTPERPYAWQEFDAETEPFTEILPTTWMALVREGLIAATSFNRYELTASGWIMALKVTRRFNTPEMERNAGRLAAALKRRVDGRKHDGNAERTELAQETGLEEAFIYDAIESHLLRHLFGIVDAHWAHDDQMKNYIDIPIDFGHRL
jgi:hypothetical protein